MNISDLHRLIRQHIDIDESMVPGMAELPRHRRIIIAGGICAVSALVLGVMVSYGWLAGGVSRSDVVNGPASIDCGTATNAKPMKVMNAGGLATQSQNLRQALDQYRRSLNQDKSKLKASVAAAARTRRDEMVSLLDTDPEAAWTMMQTDSRQGGWAELSSQCAEQPVTLQGTVTLERNSKGVVEYVLKTSDGQSQQLLPVKQIGRALVAGQTWKVNGLELAGRVVADASDGSKVQLLSDTKSRFRADRVIVRFKPGVTAADQVQALQMAEGSLDHQVDHQGANVVKVANGAALKAIGRLEADGRVEYAEPDFVAKMGSTPNDPRLTAQWYLNTIKAPDAWSVTQGSGSAAIAIVDTGVDSTHPDLSGRVIKEANFTTEATAADNNGHGTNVAGIASAITNNGTGVAGVAYSANLLSAKVLDTQGNGNYSDIASGLDWAVDNGAKVVNASLYGSDPSVTLQDAVNYVWSHGAVLVVCAGNDNITDMRYPAAYEPAMAVGSTTDSDTKSSFSNYGSWVDVAAPGGETNGQGILSTCLNATYCIYTGTSQATPQVAGEASLLFALHPDWDNAQVKRQIESTTDAVAGTGTNWTYGRINLAKAMQTPPDLVVKNLQLTDQNGTVKTSFAVNEPIYVKVTVGNQNATASGPKAVTQIYTNAASAVDVSTTSDIGTSIGHGVFGGNSSYWYGSWPNGQYNSSFSPTKSWTEAAAGTYTARAFINFDDSVSETDYSNNQLAVSYTVTAPSATPTPTPTPTPSSTPTSTPAPTPAAKTVEAFPDHSQLSSSSSAYTWKNSSFRNTSSSDLSVSALGFYQSGSGNQFQILNSDANGTMGSQIGSGSLGTTKDSSGYYTATLSSPATLKAGAYYVFRVNISSGSYYYGAAYRSDTDIQFRDGTSGTAAPAPNNAGTYEFKLSYSKGAASPTPTPTPATGTTTQLLKNAGFESGDNGNWTDSGVIGQWSNYPSHSGTWYAWLGGNNSMSDTLSQNVTLPASASKISLSFYMLISTQETTTSTQFDKMSVQLRDTSGNILTTLGSFSNLNKSSSYVNKSYDISSYKGKTVQVYFAGTTDNSLPTSFVIDDVAVTSTT